jgi:FAD/FMN-containing dehydrogenase
MSTRIATRRPATAIDPRALAELASSFSGELVRPGDRSYDRLRAVWNGSIDRRPALIAACRDADEVVAALRFARNLQLPLAVRGGGHSFPGLSVCDDGVVIDLAPMRSVRVDPVARTARVQAGVLLGELDRATQRFGLAVPLGSVTHTGVAGLTLGGGFGWLMRKFGLTIDHLLGVKIVTAEGQVLEASEAQHPDLFWGVRGGGGNFGVAIEFVFRLQHVGPTVLSGLMLWPLEEGTPVVRAYRDWAHGTPDDLTTALLFRRAPAVPTIPTRLHGRLVVGMAFCWVGPLDTVDAVLEPIRRAGSGIVDLSARRPYVEHQAMFDLNYPHGLWIYSKAADVATLTDDVLDLLVEHAGRIVSHRSGIIAWQLGGAVARVGELDTAFGSRSSGYLIDMLGATDAANGFEHERTWARECWSAFSPHRVGVYVNWLMDEGASHVREAYGERRFARLQSIKQRYDPENVFRLNQNIPPA